MFSYVEGGADSGLAVVSASTVALLARAAGTEITTELYRVLEVGGEGLDRAMGLLDDRAPGKSAAIVEVRDAPIAPGSAETSRSDEERDCPRRGTGCDWSRLTPHDGGICGARRPRFRNSLGRRIRDRGMTHRVALASSGQTVALLPSGVDRFYPSVGGF